MRPRNDSQEPNQGEGDKVSARKYNRDLREFIDEGKVDEAAEDARLYVERDPADAARAEAKAKRGPGSSKVSVDELVAKGRSVVERVRPYLERAQQRLRERFGRK
jgi:hypothetical protein